MYFAALLWITLLSRIENGPVDMPIYPPFWSFAEIASGNKRVIFETTANILLFIPCGVLCRLFFCWKRKKTIFFGFLCSLLIECLQLTLGLGSFELDDLLTNTIGVIIGSIIPAAKQRPSRKWYFIGLAAFILTLCVPPLLGCIHYRHMEQLAANGDRADGAKNLLVLNGQPGFAGDSNFFIRYLPDGSISIKGSSDKRAWKRIGELTLPSGSYSFSGLSGTEEKTVAIELEYYSPEKEYFIRLTADVGPVEEVFFTLEEETKIRAYVGVYPDSEGQFTARPVIYQED